MLREGDCGQKSVIIPFEGLVLVVEMEMEVEVEELVVEAGGIELVVVMMAGSPVTSIQ